MMEAAYGAGNRMALPATAGDLQKLRLDQQQDTINALLDRVRILERLQQTAAGNPLQAFDDDHLDAAPLLAEVTRLTVENRELRDRLADAHRNAEATVLVTKMAFGIQG